jgi:sugar O-acyltransferase (sialic acid O-acetyltransferase NeuD family)
MLRTMADRPKSLVVIGDGEFAEIAYEYFTHDSEHEVVAFAVEREFLEKDSLYGLPVVAVEDLEQRFAPEAHSVFVAVTYTQLNRVRARLYRVAKAKGYPVTTYVSSRAFVWPNAMIGENCFIFEHNVIQHNAVIGDNTILWSGNHIGHRATVGENCFLSSHVVVSGYCRIGDNCFIGVNCTLADHVTVAKDCFIGAGAVIARDTEEGKVYKGSREAESAAVGSLRFFRIKE